MPDPTTPMTAADEARAWIERLVRFADECNAENEANPIPEENCPPTHVSAAVRLKPLPDGRVSVYEPGVEVTPDRLRAFLAEHDEHRDRADGAEAELAEVRAWMADPYNRVRIAPVVKRAYRQRDEAAEDAAAAVEEYVADLKAAHAELAKLHAQMAAEPAPFRFGEISDEELAANEEAFKAAWAELKGQPVQIFEPARTFVSQWSVRYLEDGEDGIVSEKHHTEVEARQRAKANSRTMELVTRLVESEWRTVGGDHDA